MVRFGDGASLTDGCWVNMGMLGLTEKEGEKWGIDDWRNYVKLDLSKTNVGPKSHGIVNLKFDEAGMLHPVNLKNERIQALKGPFLDILSQDPDRYSRRELRREKCAKHIITQIQELSPDFSRSQDVNPVIDALIADVSLIETKIKIGDKRTPKPVLKLRGE